MCLQLNEKPAFRRILLKKHRLAALFHKQTNSVEIRESHLTPLQWELGKFVLKWPSSRALTYFRILSSVVVVPLVNDLDSFTLAPPRRTYKDMCFSILSSPSIKG